MKYLLFSIFFVISLISCNVKDANPNFPQKPVNLQIYPGTGAYYDLGVIGGKMFINGGYGGILIYRVNQTQFRAYDVACPHKPTDPCERIEFEKSNSFKVVDPCCSSEFLVTTGEVVKGPSEYNLQNYNTSFDGNLLTVWN
jgi:nitrite reductase/ring-hydroxylating ferredoxin subunit